MKKVSADKVVFYFDKEDEPIMKMDLPADLSIETQDCFSGTVKTEDDLVEQVDPGDINPVTGPIYFNGVEPGDVLEVKINKIHANNPGVTMCVPGEGLLKDHIEESITKVYDFDDEWVYMDKGVKVKLDPMVGIIGVAPEGEPVATLSPGDHGGNMDTTLIREGATIYLPVFQEGALFGIGDLHAIMGDGESWYTGLEVSGTTDLSIKVRKDLKMDVPFVKYGDKFAVLSSAVGTDDALEKAMLKLIEFLVEHSKLDFNEAGFLTGNAAHLEVSQVVDPLKTVRMSIETYILDQLGIEV